MSKTEVQIRETMPISGYRLLDLKLPFPDSPFWPYIGCFFSSS